MCSARGLLCIPKDSVPYLDMVISHDLQPMGFESTNKSEQIKHFFRSWVKVERDAHVITEIKFYQQIKQQVFWNNLFQQKFNGTILISTNITIFVLPWMHVFSDSSRAHTA